MDLVKIRVLKRWPGGSYDVGHEANLPKAFALKLAERGAIEILREVVMETKAVAKPAAPGKPAVPPPATPKAKVEPGKGKGPSVEKSTKAEAKASAPVPAPPAPPAAPPAAEGFLATMKKKLPWQK